MSSFRSAVLDRKYVFEYDVGLWTFGNVQVLKDRQTGQLRTCKTVQKSILRQPAEAVARLQRLRDLQHERICGIHEVLEDPSRIFIISDKCAGGDLAEWIVRVQEDGNWLQEQTVADYIRQALIAVVHAHGSRVSHRDLRLSSFALTSKLPDAQVKLCDFGLADILDPEDEVMATQAGAFCAPEVRSGQPAGENMRMTPGAAADMWSLGAVAHQLLVGSPPAEDDSGGWASLRSLSRSRAHGDPDAWSERSPLSRDFVRRMLKAQAAERPTAALALQHPWMQACVPLDPSRWVPGSEVGAELQGRLLCYVLGVLVLPELIQYKDLYQLRHSFTQADTDRDGFVATAVAQRLLRDTGASAADAATALEVVDVVSTGAADLCAVAVAYIVARSFLAKEASSERAQKRRVLLLAQKLLFTFFNINGDGKAMTASMGDLRRRLGTAVMREVEVNTPVRYMEILGALPESGHFDAQALTASITQGQGRGTPLAPADPADIQLEPDVNWGEGFNLEGLQEIVKGVFQTCGLGAEKQKGYRRIGGLGGQ